MPIPPRTQAVLLLTSRFSKTGFPETGDASKGPLSPGEWGRLASWLDERSLAPERLMTEDPDRLLDALPAGIAAPGRIKRLVDRGPALALAVEKWLRAGLWIMACFDPDYPARLKERLGGNSPAVLFGCGDRALLDKGGLAVVGSREAPDEDVNFSRELGIKAARSGRSIVSGGARGIDEASMMGSLESGGTVVGVLAGALLNESSGKKYRTHLREKNLALVSSSHPDAGVHRGGLLQRNKYIYCLSDAAVVVHSRVNEGGSWRGAMENLKNEWTPLWVHRTADGAAGNAEIAAKAGGKWLPEHIKDVDVGALSPGGEPGGSVRPRTGPGPFSDGRPSASPPRTGELPLGCGRPAADAKDGESGREAGAADAASAGAEETGFYGLFLVKVKAACGGEARTRDELRALFDRQGVKKTQFDAWLKQAVDEGRMEKTTKTMGKTRRVRYQWAASR